MAKASSTKAAMGETKGCFLAWGRNGGKEKGVDDMLAVPLSCMGVVWASFCCVEAVFAGGWADSGVEADKETGFVRQAPAEGRSLVPMLGVSARRL